jgi:acyl carrier protein
VRIVGVPNARVRTHVIAAELIARGEGGKTAGDLRSALHGLPAKGLDPSAVRELDPAYEISTTWSAAGVDRFDIVARHRTKGPARVLVGRAVATEPARDLASYANAPGRAFSGGALNAELRAYLRGKLPETMVPSAFVTLDAFPLTPNGKVDRSALPAPEVAREESAATYSAPRNEVERTIAAVWQDLLSIERVSVDKNFFDLGANSLMMVQANGRLRVALGKGVPLLDLFRFPTVRALAARVVDAEVDAAEVLRQSQERAEVRRDAMARRRDARQAARVND